MLAARAVLPAAFALVVLAAPFELRARSRSEREAEAQRHYRLGQIQFEQGKTLQSIESLRKAELASLYERLTRDIRERSREAANV